MTVITAIAIIRGGGTVQRARFAGYWIISKMGRKRPLPEAIFTKVQARGQLRPVSIRPGTSATWKWSGKKGFPMPTFRGRARCAAGG